MKPATENQMRSAVCFLKFIYIYSLFSKYHIYKILHVPDEKRSLFSKIHIFFLITKSYMCQMRSTVCFLKFIFIYKILHVPDEKHSLFLNIIFTKSYMYQMRSAVCFLKFIFIYKILHVPDEKRSLFSKIHIHLHNLT